MVEAGDLGSVYLLQGWRGNEDEDVNIESSEESSEGEIEGLRRQSISFSVGTRAIANQVSVETSAQEASAVAGQECESSLVNIGTSRGDGTNTITEVASANKLFSGEKASEGKGAVLPGESSGTKATETSQAKKLNDVKKLDARRFRNHFAAKFSGSKRPIPAEGKSLRESGKDARNQVLMNSSLEHSGERSLLNADSKAKVSRSSEQEEQTVTLHVNLEVEHEKGSDTANGECDSIVNVSSTRKRKECSESTTPEEDNGVGVQTRIVENVLDKQGCETSSGVKDASMSARSKRTRKHNTPSDYIHWSDFGRLPAKKIESCKADAALDSASGTETNALKSNTEKARLENRSIPNGKQVKSVDPIPNKEAVGISQHVDNDREKTSSHGLMKRDEIKQPNVVTNQNSSLETSKLAESKRKEPNLMDNNIQQSSHTGEKPHEGKSSGQVALLEPGSVLGVTESQHKHKANSERKPCEGKSSGQVTLPVPAGSALEVRESRQDHRASSKENEVGKMHHGQAVPLETQSRQEGMTMEREVNAVPPLAERAVEVIHVSKGVEEHDNVCNKCRREGKLICCDGKDCKFTIHISCLDPPLMDIPPDDWYCPDCACKRIVSGIRSVSKGIESIWDMKEGQGECRSQHEKSHEVSNGLADKRQTPAKAPPVCGNSPSSAPVDERMYFVKYKGVAHIHNIWLYESQLSKEAPKLLSAYKKQVEQGKAPKSNPDWVKPYRVIGKRKTLLSKGVVEPGPDSAFCVEWCIKWKNLGYEFCTWEPESTLALCNVDIKGLIKDYESRTGKARSQNQSGKTSKVPNRKVRPAWLNSERQDCLDVIEKLLGNWQKHLHGIIVNQINEDRITTALGFLACVFGQHQVDKPCLVVVPSALLGQWRAAIQKRMPSVNVVLYMGTKDARKIIRRYEFYNEDKICMVQVALTSFDTLNLDIDFLSTLSLEVLVVDDSQHSKGTRTRKSLRQCQASFRLLLLAEPIKENVDEYRYLLAVLSEKNGDSTLSLPQLQAVATKHMVQMYKPDAMESTYPKEFWVPVKMTAFQVEEYCKILIDKFDMLARVKRGDIGSSPHDLLLKIRECCNHPYLVNPAIQEPLVSLTPKELLEFGIRASGKLKLLDLMLSEAKSSKKRVLIITQMHLRAGKVSQMDILDDYMRQQFGINSYERVDGGLHGSKKVAAVDRFNALDSESFVFLLDRRACGPSVKLHSVDCIVIFDSDWLPQTDIHTLQRMYSHGDLERMAICRFYCPDTIEERVLISARKHLELDNNHHNFTFSLCQKLLRWGARKNFELFDSLPCIKDQAKMTDELEYSTELVNALLGKASIQSTDKLCALHAQTALCPRRVNEYINGIPLFGETSEELDEEAMVPASEFWIQLLRDRQVEVPDGQGRELRARKKVQYHEDSFRDTINPDESVEEEESRRKKRKLAEVPDQNPIKNGKFNLLDKMAGVSNSVPRVEPLDKATHFSIKTFDNADKGNPQMGSASEPSQVPSGPHANKNGNESKTLGPQSSGNDRGASEPSQVPSGLHANKNGNESKTVGPQSSGNDRGSEPSAGSTEQGTAGKTEQQQLLLTMKVDLERLCQALQFQADTAAHVEHLRLSIGSFFKLPKDKNLLHAIELSLCWLAAEQQHYSIDRQATLTLAQACFGVQLDRIESVYTKLEERWKKRFEQGAPRQSSSARAAQDQHVPLQSDDGRVQDPEMNPLGDRQGESSIAMAADGPSQRNQETGGFRDTLQGGEQLQGSAPGEASERQMLREQPLHRSRFHMPERPEELQDRGSVSEAQVLQLNEKQRSTRVLALINAQTVQTRNLERLESNYKHKLRQHYDSKLRSSSPGDVDKLSEGFKSAHNALVSCFRVARSNLMKKQMDQRKAFASADRHDVGESPLLSLSDVGIDEKVIYDSFSLGLKAALENGDFGLISTTTSNDFALLSGSRSHPSIACPSFLQQTGTHHPPSSSVVESLLNAPVSIEPGHPSLSIPESPVHATSSQQQQMQVQQGQLPDGFSQQRQQQERGSGLSLPPLPVAISGPQEEHQQQCTQPQLLRSHLQQLLSRPAVPTAPSPSQSPSSLIPPQPPSQPQPQSQPQPLAQAPPQPPAQAPPQPPAQAQPQPQPLPQLQPQFRPQPQPQPHLQLHLHPQSHPPLLPQLHPQPQPQTQSQPQTHSLPQVLSRQHPQLRDVQPTQPSQSGVTIAPVQQQLTGLQGLSSYPSDTMVPLAVVATHPITLPSVRIGTSSAASRSMQSGQPRTNQLHHNDPLAQEHGRLRKEQEKSRTAHENERDRIKAQFMKELEVLSKRYDDMLQEEDNAYHQKATALELNLKKVEMNRRLAEVFRLKNSQDKPVVTTATIGQDSRMLVGASQGQNPLQPPSSFMASRSPLPQPAVTPPGLPPLSAAAIANVFERLPCGPIPSSVAAAQPLGPHTGAYSPVLGQARPFPNSCQVALPMQRALPSTVAGNSSIYSSPASFVQPQNMLVASLPQTAVSQFIGGSRTVTTYATSVTSQYSSNPTSVVPRDPLRIGSEALAGMALDSSLSRVSPTVPDVLVTANERLALDSFSREMLPPFDSGDGQANRTIPAAQGQDNQETLTRTELLAHCDAIGLGPVPSSQYEDRNIGPADIICLSDDD